MQPPAQCEHPNVRPSIFPLYFNCPMWSPAQPNQCAPYWMAMTCSMWSLTSEAVKINTTLRRNLSVSHLLCLLGLHKWQKFVWCVGEINKNSPWCNDDINSSASNTFTSESIMTNQFFWQIFLECEIFASTLHLSNVVTCSMWSLLVSPKGGCIEQVWL